MGHVGMIVTNIIHVMIISLVSLSRIYLHHCLDYSSKFSLHRISKKNYLY